MTTVSPAQCFACTRLHPSASPTDGREAVTCDAFPGGIPIEISQGMQDHRRPHGGERDGLLFDKAAGPRADFDFESWELRSRVPTP
jgi:hypothetical protein